MRVWAPWLLLAVGVGEVILAAAIGLWLLMVFGVLTVVGSLIVAVFCDH